MTKTVLESKFVELKGLDRISAMVHEMKCLWREINKDDVGIDGEIEVLRPKTDEKGYEVTGGIIKVQAKSGASYIKEDKADSFSVPSKTDDFRTWYNAAFPTIFIIYHPKDDKLYWKEMRTYIKNTKNVWQAPINIRFNKSTDVFDPKSKKSVQNFCEASPSRVSRIDKEKVYSNLLKVLKKPNNIWSAPCKKKTQAEVYEDIKGTTPPFIVVSKIIYTFSDLNKKDCVLREYCNVSEISNENADAFISKGEDRERDYVNLLNQLIGKHLWKQGIRYNRDFRRNFFPREDEESLEFKKEWYNLRTKMTAERTTTKYYEYGWRKFWRHLAANFKFRLIGDAWYLQITPQYLFTNDGKEPCNSDMVGPYTTRIKSDETNQNVLNHVLFWSKAISGLKNKDLISNIYFGDSKRPIMIIDRIPTTGITEFAIPYDPATYDEPERLPVQTSLLSFFNQFADDDEVTEEESGKDNGPKI